MPLEWLIAVMNEVRSVRSLRISVLPGPSCRTQFIIRGNESVCSEADVSTEELIGRMSITGFRADR